jgi:hypothetical protein
MDLAHLGDDDESLPVHVERVCLLDVAGQYENQQVAGTQPVVLVHRPGLGRLEPRRGAAECLQPEQLEALALEDAHRVGQGVGASRVRSGEIQGVE